MGSTCACTKTNDVDINRKQHYKQTDDEAKPQKEKTEKQRLLNDDGNNEQNRKASVQERIAQLNKGSDVETSTKPASVLLLNFAFFKKKKMLLFQTRTPFFQSDRQRTRNQRQVQSRRMDKRATESTNSSANTNANANANGSSMSGLSKALEKADNKSTKENVVLSPEKKGNENDNKIANKDKDKDKEKSSTNNGNTNTNTITITNTNTNTNTANNNDNAKKSFKWMVKTTSQRKLESRQKGGKAVNAGQTITDAQNKNIKQVENDEVNNDDDDDDHQDHGHERGTSESMSLSVKDRMSLYTTDLENIDTRNQARIHFHKDSRGINEIQVDSSLKQTVASNFQKRLEKQKKGTLAPSGDGNVGEGEDAGMSGTRGSSGGLDDLLARMNRASNNGKHGSVGSSVDLSSTTESRATGVGGKRRKRGRRPKVDLGDDDDTETADANNQEKQQGGEAKEQEEQEEEELTRVTNGSMSMSTTLQVSDHSEQDKPRGQATLNDVLRVAQREHAVMLVEQFGLFQEGLLH
ncbi:hypothetical protein RFI_00672, partial [Reticulomyxa filosa]